MNTTQVSQTPNTAGIAHILGAVHAAQMDYIRDAASALTVIAWQLHAYAEADEPLPNDALKQLALALEALPVQLRPLSLEDASDGDNIIDLDIERARRHWGH